MHPTSAMIAPALCLLWALAALARPTPPIPTGGPEEPAQGEELTLLFHGALQLGQALNGVYKSTDTQLTEAGRNLGLYGHTLQLLRGDVSRGWAAARELRASLKEMQVSAAPGAHVGSCLLPLHGVAHCPGGTLGHKRKLHLSSEQTEGVALQLQAEATAQELAELAQAQRSLRDSVQRLEGKLRGAWLGQAQYQELEALKVRGSEPLCGAPAPVCTPRLPTGTSQPMTGTSWDRRGPIAQKTLSMAVAQT